MHLGVPVMSGCRGLELADPSRVRQLAKAPNARLIRRRRDGKVVEIQLSAAGDDSARPERHTNPRRYSYDHETDENPSGVWTLKHIPTAARPVFRAVLDDCAA